MRYERIYTTTSLFFILFLLFGCSKTGRDDLFSRVGGLNLTRGEYTLGKVLTNAQRKIASANPIPGAKEGVYKFRDGDLIVVADETNHRILIMYEQYDQVSVDKVKALVGSLYIDFGDPTVMAHDKIIYWAYTQDGKMTEEQFKKVKKKEGKLNVLAVVKLISSQEIMSQKGTQLAESIYYIISSEPILKMMQGGE